MASDRLQSLRFYTRSGHTAALPAAPDLDLRRDDLHFDDQGVTQLHDQIGRHLEIYKRLTFYRDAIVVLDGSPPSTAGHAAIVHMVATAFSAPTITASLAACKIGAAELKGGDRINITLCKLPVFETPTGGMAKHDYPPSADNVVQQLVSRFQSTPALPSPSPADVEAAMHSPSTWLGAHNDYDQQLGHYAEEAMHSMFPISGSELHAAFTMRTSFGGKNVATRQMFELLRRAAVMYILVRGCTEIKELRDDITYWPVLTRRLEKGLLHRLADIMSNRNRLVGQSGAAATGLTPVHRCAMLVSRGVQDRVAPEFYRAMAAAPQPTATEQAQQADEAVDEDGDEPDTADEDVSNELKVLMAAAPPLVKVLLHAWKNSYKHSISRKSRYQLVQIIGVKLCVYAMAAPENQHVVLLRPGEERVESLSKKKTFTLVPHAEQLIQVLLALDATPSDQFFIIRPPGAVMMAQQLQNVKERAIKQEENALKRKAQAEVTKSLKVAKLASMVEKKRQDLEEAEHKLKNPGQSKKEVKRKKQAVKVRSPSKQLIVLGSDDDEQARPGRTMVGSVVPKPMVRPYGIQEHVWQTYMYGLSCADKGECPPLWRLPAPGGLPVLEELKPGQLNTLRVGTGIGGANGPSVSSDCINSYCSLISRKLAVDSPHIKIVCVYAMGQSLKEGFVPNADHAFQRQRMEEGNAVIVHGIFHRDHHFVLFSAHFGSSLLECYDPLCVGETYTADLSAWGDHLSVHYGAPTGLPPHQRRAEKVKWVLKYEPSGGWASNEPWCQGLNSVETTLECGLFCMMRMQLMCLGDHLYSKQSDMPRARVHVVQALVQQKLISPEYLYMVVASMAVELQAAAKTTGEPSGSPTSQSLAAHESQDLQGVSKGGHSPQANRSQEDQQNGSPRVSSAQPDEAEAWLLANNNRVPETLLEHG